MWKLVLETGAESCQVGLLRGKEIEGGWRWDWPRAQVERLVWMAQAVLAQTGLSWSQLDGIIVNQGPGSHTGLRVGLSAAKAWALRWNLALYPVPLLRVLYTLGQEVFPDEKRLLTLWRARSQEAYGRLWEHAELAGVGEIQPLATWAASGVPWVGNCVLKHQPGIYVPEISWQQVARAATGVEPLQEPLSIASLVPLYFRPFVPTTRGGSSA